MSDKRLSDVLLDMFSCCLLLQEAELSFKRHLASYSTNLGIVLKRNCEAYYAFLENSTVSKRYIMAVMTPSPCRSYAVI